MVSNYTTDLEVGDLVRHTKEAAALCWGNDLVSTVIEIRDRRGERANPLVKIKYDDGTMDYFDAVWLERAPDPKLFIIWQPEYHAPPKVKFTSQPDAERAAGILAQRNPGKTFYVLQAVSATEAEVQPVSVRTISNEDLPPTLDSIFN